MAETVRPKAGPPRERILALTERERDAFIRTHQGSRELYERAGGSLFGGVPMSWMMKWAGGFPVFAERAEGSTVFDVDGNEYADFCLGDTGAMTGHAPPAVADAAAEQAARAITTMMPSPDAPVGGRSPGRAFRFAALAGNPERHRREPVRHPDGAPDHRSSPHPGLQLVLPRHRGRDLRRPARRTRRLPPRQRRPARGARTHDAGCRVQRRRGAGGSPRPRGRGVRAGRAGHDQHRYSATRTGPARRAEGPHASPRYPPDHRRDPHHLHRLRWLHARARARPGHPNRRQDHRRRRAGRGFWRHPRGRREGPRAGGRRLRGRRRRRRDPRRQRALRGGDAHGPDRGADRGGLPAHRAAGRALRARA